MLVYGDRRCALTVSEAVRRTVESVRGAHDASRAAQSTAWIESLGRARDALIAAGQLEQAVHDLGHHVAPSRLAGRADVTAAQAACDAVAAGFVARWARTQAFEHDRVLRLLGECDVAAALRDAVRHLGCVAREVADHAGAGADPVVSVTVPEGFHAYALLPEQYAAAAHEWVRAHGTGPGEPALVVGLRSIGTTLSAVVAAVLRASGRRVERVTVRPTGHPYRRHVVLAPHDPTCDRVGTGWAFVVDEGPGRSGSSIAATVEALRGAGTPPDRIVILPGHDGGPGAERGAREQELWATTAQIVVPPSALRWHGETLDGILARRARTLLDGDVRVDVEHVDVAWRQPAFGDAAQWPAVATAFARPARRCVATDGGAVLWRFAGVDACAVVDAWTRSSSAAWRPTCHGNCWGFVGTSWVDGTPLTAADRGPATLSAVAAYLADSAGAAMSADELVASVERLAFAVEHDVRAALGHAAACRAALAGARALALAGAHARAASTRGSHVSRATDGRTDPHGWVRTAGGRLRKVDGFGPEHDHTLVGAQPLAWDVAGAIVSWELDGQQRRTLLDQLVPRHPDLAWPGWVRFHEVARATIDLARLVMSAPAGAPGDDRRHALALAQAHRRLESRVETLDDDAAQRQPVAGIGS